MLRQRNRGQRRRRFLVKKVTSKLRITTNIMCIINPFRSIINRILSFTDIIIIIIMDTMDMDAMITIHIMGVTPVKGDTSITPRKRSRLGRMKTQWRR